MESRSLSREEAVPISALAMLTCVSSAPSGGTREGDGPRSSTAFDIMQEATSRRTSRQLTPDDTILELLNHPAFDGFGRLLLPWDDRTYDTSLRLRDVSSLLPYHTHVDPATVVSALNHMIDDVNKGQSVFYDFYTENEKREQPTKSNTGLFFFRGRPGAPFAMIAPGGGFAYVGSVHEGFPYAAVIAKHGYNAFVLKYRAAAGGAAATQDLAAVISYVFRHAQTLGVGTEGYSVWGSSAGARMAAAIGSHGVARFGGDNLPTPSAVVMAYTGHSDFSTSEPSTFVVVGERDGIAPPPVIERRVQALRKLGTDVEFHRYRVVGHGFGPGIGTSAEGWLDGAVRFWAKAIRSNERRVR
jgi:acetyl esterase/lipase